MNSAIVTVRPQTSAKQAARLLTSHGFTALPVVDDTGRLVGVVTEADLLRRRILPDPRTLVHDQPPDREPEPASSVAEVMTTDVITAGRDVHVAALSRLMLDRHVRAVPIVDQGQLVGIVSRSDLLRTIARDDEVIARDVQHHLSLAGRQRWEVTVTDGVVTLVGDGADDMERHIATVVAGTVPGVVGVKPSPGVLR